jgi:putative photosynthetic complex assembly protein
MDSRTPRSPRAGFPRSPLLAAGLAIAVTIGGVAWVQRSGVDPMRPSGTPQVTRDLRFEDTAHGAIRVSDATTGRLVVELEPGTGGFVRATLRGFARERRMADAPGPESPFRLTAWTDGRLTLEDPATGRFVDLGAFGPSQVESFTNILLARPQPAHGQLGAGQLAQGGTPR